MIVCNILRLLAKMIPRIHHSLSVSSAFMDLSLSTWDKPPIIFRVKLQVRNRNCSDMCVHPFWERMRHSNAFDIKHISVETRLPCSLVDENVVAPVGVSRAAAAPGLGGDSIDIWNVRCKLEEVWGQLH